MTDQSSKVNLAARKPALRFCLADRLKRCKIPSVFSRPCKPQRINRDFAPLRLRKQQHAAARTGRVHRGPNQAISRRCQNHRVRATSLVNSLTRSTGSACEAFTLCRKPKALAIVSLADTNRK